MANISQLNKSIADMSREEALVMIMEVRGRRYSTHQLSKKTKAKKAVAKDNVKVRKTKAQKIDEAMAQMTPEQLEQIKTLLLGG